MFGSRTTTFFSRVVSVNSKIKSYLHTDKVIGVATLAVTYATVTEYQKVNQRLFQAKEELIKIDKKCNEIEALISKNAKRTWEEFLYMGSLFIDLAVDVKFDLNVDKKYEKIIEECKLETRNLIPFDICDYNFETGVLFITLYSFLKVNLVLGVPIISIPMLLSQIIINNIRR